MYFLFPQYSRGPTIRVLFAVRLELVAQFPVVSPRAHDMRLLAASPLQTAHCRSVLRAYPALMSAAVPNGRLQADNARPNDVHSGCPHQTVLVHPHLVRVVSGFDHTVENVVRELGLVGRARLGCCTRTWYADSNSSF